MNEVKMGKKLSYTTESPKQSQKQVTVMGPNFSNPTMKKGAENPFGYSNPGPAKAVDATQKAWHVGKKL